MDSNTYNLIARIYLARSNVGTVEPREPADWAMELLEAGFDSKNLRMLASEFDSKSFSDVEPHFRKSIKELGWEYPSKELSIDKYSESILGAILRSEIDPMEGCRILSDLCIFLDYPTKLYNWNGLYWAHEDLDDESVRILIRDEAEKQLKGERTEVIHEGFMHRPVDEMPTSFWQRIKGLIK